MGICYEIQIEYQRQLNLPYILSTPDRCDFNNAKAKDMNNEHQDHSSTSQRLGTAGNVLLLTLDLWSNRIGTGGSDGGGVYGSAGSRKRHVKSRTFEPDRPLISESQWKFIENVLNELEIEEDNKLRNKKLMNAKRKAQNNKNKNNQMMNLNEKNQEEEEEEEDDKCTEVGTVDTILIAMDVPFTGRTPAEVDQLEKSRNPTWARDDWSCREKEYCRLIKLFFDWKLKKRLLRDCWFVTGGSSITPGGESFITDINTGTRIRQIVVGPATGLPTGALPEKEIHFGNGCYTRTPVSRTFFRNYGVVHVKPPNNLALNSFGGRPGSSQSVRSGRPSTSGSGWTSSSSLGSKGPVSKSKTRISLITQSNFSRGDAHPYPPTELTPRWWNQKTGRHPYSDSIKKNGRSRPNTSGSSQTNASLPGKANGMTLSDRKSVMERKRDGEEEEKEEKEQLKVQEVDNGMNGFEALGLDTSMLSSSTLVGRNGNNRNNR